MSKSAPAIKLTDGFSIMTVMIGSVVVAALAVVYMQKARNRAQVAAITDIIAYRDYAFRYYSEVAANRMAWPCTLKANPDLKTYVRGGGGPAGPHNLWLYDVSGTGCVLAGTGKEIITGSGAGTAQGLGLKLYTALPTDPVETYDPDNHHVRVYSTWEGLAGDAVRIRLAASYNYERDDALTSFKIKEKETFIYMGRTPARNCGEALGFHDDYGSGDTAPKRYFGDTAVTSLNAQTRLVTCWEQGPLVIPPCFDLLERDGGNLSFSTRCPSLGTDKAINYAGMCPKESALVVPAAGGFAISTGKTICERDYALVLGDRTSSSARHCSPKDDLIAFGGIGSSHEGLCRGYGTIGRRCADGYQGWNNGIADCWSSSKIGLRGPKGKPGIPNVLPAEKGDRGPDITCPEVTETIHCTSGSPCPPP